MSKKKCSFCEATTSQGIVKSGWMAVDLHFGKGKSHERLVLRACPEHIGRIMPAVMEFERVINSRKH